MHADAVGATAIREELDRLVMRVDEGYGGVGGRDMNGLATLVAHYATGRDFAMLERSGWSPIEVYSTAIRGIRSSRPITLETSMARRIPRFMRTRIAWQHSRSSPSHGVPAERFLGSIHSSRVRSSAREMSVAWLFPTSSRH